jgi:nucleotide-binding universal stress UspA family protein
MNTFTTLLVAVDQSDASDRAVLVARDIAQLAGASLRLLHVREHQVVAGKGGGVFDLEEPEQVEQLLKK